MAGKANFFKLDLKFGVKPPISLIEGRNVAAKSGGSPVSAKDGAVGRTNKGSDFNHADPWLFRQDKKD